MRFPLFFHFMLISVKELLFCFVLLCFVLFCFIKDTIQVLKRITQS